MPVGYLIITLKINYGLKDSKCSEKSRKPKKKKMGSEIFSKVQPCRLLSRNPADMA